MAIKPKSRAHEERIKALEDDAREAFELIRRLAAVGGSVARRVEALERPWYKRIFGL